MKTTGIARIAAALAVITTLSACAGRTPPFPIPDDPGLYALTRDKELHRLDGDRDWEVKHWPDRSNLPTDTRFVIRDPAIASDAAVDPARFQLWRVSWVRSEIGDENLAMPIKGSPWAVAAIEPFQVPVSVLRAPGEPAVMLTPGMPMTPGLYDLRLVGSGGGASDARLGILWSSVDQRQYSAHNCVDRYLTQDSYRTCTGQVEGLQALSSQTMSSQPMSTQSMPMQTMSPQAMSTAGLTITLLDPLRSPDGLLVQGVVTNTTAQTKRMPLMQVTLRNDMGQEISHRVIQPSVATLAPGGRMTFRTALEQPSGPAKVNVALIPYPDAGL